ncbi:MAG: peptide chain release factor-like protein [Candidatus Omnitrophota bacterium]
MLNSIFNVSPQKEKNLRARMQAAGVSERDIVELFVRSGKSGGQNVNKTSTCVYLKHLPTKIEVKCQQERSQALNRYLARKILVAKIENMVLGRKSAQQKLIAKIRRQKRKRSKRAKEKMLDSKKMRSQKKQLRSFKPSPEAY